MAPIFLPPIHYSANMMYASAKNQGQTPDENQKSTAVTIPNLCDVICDPVFKDVQDPKEAEKLFLQWFEGNCDSICDTICGPICDGVI